MTLDHHSQAEHANDVFFLYDDAGHRLHVSPSCHRVLGYEADELTGFKRYAFVHPDDVEVVRRRYAELSPECPEVSSIHRFRRKDGQYIWVEGLVRLVPPTTRTSSLLIATVRDITERTRAEDALRESEQRFRGAFETSAHGFALVSPDGRWLRVNAAFCRIVGYTERDLLALDFQSITHPDDLAADLSYVRAMLAGEIASYQMEKRYLHKTGKIIEILLSVSLVHDSDGQPLHFVAQILDITERKKAEQEASRLRGLLVEAIEAMQDGVVLFDSQDRLVLANTAVRRPYSSDDIFVPRRAYEDIVRSYWAAANLAPEEIEQRVSIALERHRRGDGVPWEVQILPGAWQLMRHFRTRDGGILTVSTDITALKDKQAKLEAALMRAEAANIAKRDFLATMSHELRTPLNAIIGFSNIIADQMFGPLENAQYLDFANEIHRSGQHLLGLIDAILEYSNADAAELKLARAPVDMGIVVRSAVDAVAARSEMGGIELECAIPGDLPMVIGDAARIRQILINLLTNAIKFTDRGGAVRLSAATTVDAKIAIAIRDTGIGIAEEHLSRVFEPFYMVDGGINRSVQDGIGLGLPLARRLAELSGGSVALESEFGVGTTATIVLPSLRQQCDLTPPDGLSGCQVW